MRKVLFNAAVVVIAKYLEITYLPIHWRAIQEMVCPHNGKLHICKKYEEELYELTWFPGYSK